MFFCLFVCALTFSPSVAINKPHSVCSLLIVSWHYCVHIPCIFSLYYELFRDISQPYNFTFTSLTVTKLKNKCFRHITEFSEINVLCICIYTCNFPYLCCSASSVPVEVSHSLYVQCHKLLPPHPLVAVQVWLQMLNMRHTTAYLLGLHYNCADGGSIFL
jgi:hypothetical protein